MENPYTYLMGVGWRHVGSRKKMFVLTYVFLVTANVLYMLEPLVIGQAFNSLQQGGDNVLIRFTGWLVLYTLITPIFWSLHGPARVWERQLSFHIVRRFRQRMFKKLTRMPMAWHNDHHSGETHDKVEKAANALFHFTSSSFEPLSTFVKAVFSVVAMTILFPAFGWMSVVALVVILTIMTRFDVYLMRNRKVINEREHSVAQLFFDYVTNIKSIITLRLEKLVARSYSKGIGHVFPPLKKNIFVNEIKWGSLSNMVAAVTFVMLFIYVFSELKAGNIILLGSLFAFYGYVQRFTGAFFNFAWQWNDLVEQQTDAHAVDSINADYERLVTTKAIKGDISEWKEITITDLDFSHSDARGNVNHLDGVAIKLHREKTIALVGESGSGKSTLLHLLRGLFDPDRSKLLIDGDEHDFKMLSTITTLVPQDPEVFDNTIGYNISLGIDHTEEEVITAVQLARFAPVLSRLERGLETSIKERGVNLSGGEKQRLALARAIFTAKDSSLILMDESTSSVDSTNELEIYNNLFEYFDDRCIVAAIHRLHLLPLFDEVYVLDKGKVIEHGSFAELSAKNGGVLAGMWQTYLATLDTEE